MHKKPQNNMPEKQKVLIQENGKIYFSRHTERRFFFILTIVMLLAGILFKAGWF